ncbi:MAG TPA: peptidyl-prolyl cis-trans isomerase [Candidatus Limnocylindria bacterium]|nr:peptidyl-prolyl cis-trans isomerase [Candidatus Limnocylindria bacterium]
MSVRARETWKWIGVTVAACAAWAALAQERGTPATETAVATVGSLRVTRAEYDQRSSRLMADFKSRTGAEPPAEVQPVIRRQLLENMIRHRLLMLEVERRGLTVTDAEAEAELQRDPALQRDGQFDRARFLAFKTGNSKGYASSLRLAKLNLAAQRLQQSIENQHRPSEDQVRERALRKLTRGRVSYLALRGSEFDGGHPEPRESEVLAEYRAQIDNLRIPDEATLTVLFVHLPRLPDSRANQPDAVRAWEQRMRARADSALAEAKRGTDLDALGSEMGGIRRNEIVRSGEFPSYWRGDARAQATVLKARGWLAEPVRGVPGWLLVRVEDVRTSRIAPMQDVAGNIRNHLRTIARSQREDRLLRALYHEVRDSLRAPAYRIRYAVADSASFDPGVPSATELDLFYRAHLADYSSFDPVKGAVVARRLSEIQEELVEWWRRERRADLVRDAAGRLQTAWSRNQRDATLERRMTTVREVGPVPAGGAVDTGLAGRALTDTLTVRGYARGAGIVRYRQGAVVYQVIGEVPDHVPDFAAARPLLANRAAARKALEDEHGARALFERDPEPFKLGNVIHFSRLVVSPPEPISIPLTRKEIVQYREKHRERYSAPELVRVRHILILPAGSDARADSAARQRADEVLRRARAGESFIDLAEQYSDDTPTKHDGGDLGPFGRGVMLPEIERAAFQMEPDEVAGPVRSQVGYHVLKCLEHLPEVAQPLMQGYTNIGMDAAREKGDQISQFRADSIYRACRTPAQARAAARKLGVEILHNQHSIGDKANLLTELGPYFSKMEKLKPGEFVTGSQQYRGLGYVVTWVDSITPARAPTWENARPAAVERYLGEAGTRAIDAKTAELDSMLASGWSLDSLATLWGGLQTLEDFKAGQALPRVGPSKTIDSLVTSVGGRALAPGRLSQWVALPSGRVKLRIEERREPHRVELANTTDNERRLAVERSMVRYFDDLKRRFPVRILDQDLRSVVVPPLPD